MDNSSSSCGSASSNTLDRLKMLYPFVNEEDTPLPRCWSSKDKYNFIGLSQNNLRVHYKGILSRNGIFFVVTRSSSIIYRVPHWSPLGYGKTHKDAASVRATHAIPSACGLYYFEVKIVSKGRDGYVVFHCLIFIYLY